MSDQAQNAKGKGDQIRLMIWSLPRSLSTAFLRTMSARTDTKIFWEPYTNCFCHGPERKTFWADEIEGSYNEKYTFWYTKALLEEPHPDASILFAKCLIYAIAWDYKLVAKGYRHTFLIRHPKKMFRSYEKLSGGSVLPVDFKIYKNSYHDLEAFYNHVTSELGQSDPPIIDADDLLADPEKVLRKYCDAVGVPFTPKMLQWESVNGPRELNWECADVGVIMNEELCQSILFSKVFRTTGFEKIQGRTAEIEYSEDVLGCANHALPAYKRLYERRLKP